MSNIQILMLLSLLSLVVTMVVYPHVLRYARHFNVVDNPDARKLHRQPVPVMGGVAVYIGILAGCMAMSTFVRGASFNWSIMSFTTMLVLGVWDDMKSLSAILRLLVQFGIVGLYIGLTGHYIGNFYGLFGIYELSPWVGIPLSLIAGVGTINAINMIDGVDGYSSGYGLMACTSFAVIFTMTGRMVWAALAAIVASVLIPFFMHNVFGKRSKMFIGDGGTMMLGFMMVIFEFGVLSFGCGSKLESRGIGPIALVLAILCIPIFDTMRVMIARIVRGYSPFKPDKSHLHHLFIDMGFSHLGAAISILLLNMIVMLSWFLLWRFGASVNMQFCIVALMGFTVTFALYKLMRWQQFSSPVGADGMPQGGALWHKACRLGRWSHREDKVFWLKIQMLVDNRWLRLRK